MATRRVIELRSSLNKYYFKEDHHTGLTHSWNTLKILEKYWFNFRGVQSPWIWSKLKKTPWKVFEFVFLQLLHLHKAGFAMRVDSAKQIVFKRSFKWLSFKLYLDFSISSELNFSKEFLGGTGFRRGWKEGCNLYVSLRTVIIIELENPWEDFKFSYRISVGTLSE